MSQQKIFPYLIGALFFVSFCTILRTPFGNTVVPFGFILGLVAVLVLNLITVFQDDLYIQQEAKYTILIIFILLLMSLVSTTWSHYPKLTLQRAIMSFFVPLSMFLIISVDNNKIKTFKIISGVLFCIATILSISGIFIYLFGHNTVINGDGIQILSVWKIDLLQNTMGPENRISSPFLYNPNQLAGLIMISVPLSIPIFINTRSPVIASGIGAQLIALLLTFSRSGLVTTLTSIMILVVLLLYEIKLKHVLKIIFLSIIPIILVTNYLPGIDRLVSSSFATRKSTWSALYESFIHNPIIGTGFGVSNETILFQLSNTANSGHSDYFAVLAELGSIGLILFLLLLIVSSFVGIKNYINANKNQRIYLSVAIAVFVSLSIRGLVETIIIRPSFSQLCWAYMLAYITNIHS